MINSRWLQSGWKSTVSTDTVSNWTSNECGKKPMSIVQRGSHAVDDWPSPPYVTLLHRWLKVRIKAVYPTIAGVGIRTLDSIQDTDVSSTNQIGHHMRSRALFPRVYLLFSIIWDSSSIISTSLRLQSHFMIHTRDQYEWRCESNMYIKFPPTPWVSLFVTIDFKLALTVSLLPIRNTEKDRISKYGICCRDWSTVRYQPERFPLKGWII